MAEVDTIVKHVEKNLPSTLKEVLVRSPGAENNKLAVASPDDGVELSYGELINEIQNIHNT